MSKETAGAGSNQSPAAAGVPPKTIPRQLGQTETAPPATAAPAAAPVKDSGLPPIPPGASIQEILEANNKAMLAMVDAMMQRAEERWARNRPVQITHGLAAESTTPAKILDIPVDRALDSVQRSDLDYARADPLTFADHAAHLAFLNEDLVIRVAESTDPNDQAIFPLSVNGRQVFLERGVPTRIRRFYVEQLFRAKPQKVKIAVGKNQEGDVVNRTTKTSALAFPFEILEDRNPMGRAWANNLMREG